MKPYPEDRTDQPVPGLDPTSLDIDEARRQSLNCGVCLGQGFAMIYNPRYNGDIVEIDRSDMLKGPQRKLMRSVAYCVCPAGRKMQALHQVSSKDVYHRTPDVHDIVAGKYPNWQTDDPTEKPLTDDEQSRLPENFRRLLADRMRLTQEAKR